MEPLFAEICRRYGLGELECSPVPLTGGFMHKMYALSAARGRYALKLLNPHVMRRATAMANYRTAERLETLLEEHRLPILPALEFGGRKMQELDGRFFYLFDWYGGTALKGVEVTPEHCRKIGRVLARIHAVDRKEAPFEREKMHIDWESLAGALRRENEELYRLLQENRGILEQSERNGNQAAERMPPLLAVCHRDMDCKNVLWRGGEFRIIDLECLDYWHPFLELYETALCWAGYEECRLEPELLCAFVASYAEAGGELPADWELLYDADCGRLEWLEYNLRRALGVDCGADEREIGVGEVRATIAHAAYYHRMKSIILDCLLRYSQ